MDEIVATFDMVNVNPKQKANHAHITGDTITLHWHDLESEPEEGGGGIVFSREDWMKIMTAVYWKKEEIVETSGSEGTNLVNAEVHPGYVIFRYKRGKKKVEEEVSVLSLRQVDGRLRKRHR